MARYNLKQLWTKACEHDGIEPSNTFVVFSKANPWAKKYNKLFLLLVQRYEVVTHYEEVKHA